MSRILYTSPQRQTIIDPSPEDIRFAIFEQPWIEWSASANAEASLNVILDEDDDLHARHLFSSKYTIAEGSPAVIIKQPDSDEFFISWLENGGWLVPYNGESCEEYRSDHSGGCEFKIPVACLIEPDTAYSVIMEFVENQARSCKVDWHSRSDLPLPDEIYECE